MVDIQEKAELHAEELLQLLQAEETADFRDLFLELHPYEQAMFYREQEKDNRMRVYHFLSPKEMAEIMEYIELEETEKFITEMDPQFATMVIAELAADDAVDILKELTKDEVASFLAIMEKQPAEEIKALLHYEEKTAGSIMTTEYIAFIKTQTVKETMKEMKVKAPDAETIYYTYVLDESKRLAGVVSLRDLIVADENELLENVMNENVVSVKVGRDQEEIARMMRDYDFLAVPVVDFQNHLLGIITVDDILDVMDEEASDDYSKFAAVVDIDTKDSSPTQAAKMRLPWLIILLFLGMVTASLIDSFEETLEAVPVVAIFIPLIAGMAGNAGTQSLAVAVRGLAVGTYGKDNKLKLLLREMTTGLLVGGTCGIIIIGVIYVWKGNLFLGLLVGIAILATLTVATISGALIPLIMEKFNIDPAVASGPFITTLNDVTSVIIYFGMATAFMGMLVS
ncbi:MAG TPA: magnesium transporter [Candidatus Pseudogracilibacillus intestinigallinarum]|uniref:Magnesium transporter MgtE n=1 Tax=Candidatus Pseudogracilibacillus intestinigallinarum TaxID=2838742 RepID=A0A9D1TKU0_9BACI|nr:magnesium transporter [Candidatus Pseudogracilibacillus intestinigallinarum]